MELGDYEFSLFEKRRKKPTAILEDEDLPEGSLLRSLHIRRRDSGDKIQNSLASRITQKKLINHLYHGMELQMVAWSYYRVQSWSEDQSQPGAQKGKSLQLTGVMPEVDSPITIFTDCECDA